MITSTLSDIDCWLRTFPKFIREVFNSLFSNNKKLLYYIKFKSLSCSEKICFLFLHFTSGFSKTKSIQFLEIRNIRNKNLNSLSINYYNRLNNYTISIPKK